MLEFAIRYRHRHHRAGGSASVDLSLNLAPNKKNRSSQLSLGLLETLWLSTLSLFKIEE